MFLRATKLLLVTSSFTVFLADEAFSSCGKFVVVKGDVQIDIVKSQKTERAKVNSEICAGDSVTAGKEARAKIVMVDGNELNLSPDTKLKIEGYEYQPEQEKKKVLLNVLFGKVRANVKQKYDDQSKDSAANSFQVKTKSAVAGVRGTDFLTSYTPSTGKSEVVTFSGKVDVGQLGASGKILNAVSVNAGQRTFTAPNQPPVPAIAIPASELKQLNTSTNASTSLPGAAATIATTSHSDSKSLSPTTKSDSRSPASASIAARMTDAKDLGGAAGQQGQSPTVIFASPIVPNLPTAAAIAAIPIIPNTSNFTHGGNATVNIIIKTPGH